MTDHELADELADALEQYARGDTTPYHDSYSLGLVAGWQQRRQQRRHLTGDRLLAVILAAAVLVVAVIGR